MLSPKQKLRETEKLFNLPVSFWAKLKMFKHFLFVACANLMFSTHEPVALHKLQCTVKHLYICSTRLTISTAHVYFSHRHEKSGSAMLPLTTCHKSNGYMCAHRKLNIHQLIKRVMPRLYIHRLHAFTFIHVCVLTRTMG